MRLVHDPLQRLGARHLSAAHRGRPAPQEAGDRGVGPQDPGALLGHAPRPQALARPAGRTETALVTIEAAPPGRGATAPASQATAGRGGALMTEWCHGPRSTDFWNRSPRSYVLGTDASARSFVYPCRQATVCGGCP